MARRLLITALGLGPYREATWRLPDGTEKVTHILQEVLNQQYKPDNIVWLLTDSVRNSSHFADARSRIDLSEEPIIVSVPENYNQLEDLWAILQGVAGFIEKGDEIIFDITHGFRSIPVMALIAVNYLRVTHQIKVVAITYGALDAAPTMGKDAEGRPRKGPVPLLDLLPLVGLLDWTNAAQRFEETGDARLLAELAKDVPKLPRTLTALSAALSLTRPREALPEAYTLKGQLAELPLDAPKPLFLLQDRLREAYADLALRNGASEKEKLQKMWQQIEWYFEHSLPLQAATLAYEWMKNVEAYNKNIIREFPSKCTPKTSYQQVHYTLYNKLSNIRNTLAHCGINDKSYTKSKVVTDRLEELRCELRRYAQENLG